MEWKEPGKLTKGHQKPSSSSLLTSPTSLLSFGTAQLSAEMVEMCRICHFLRRARCLGRPGGNAGGLFPLEGGEVKAGTREPLGMAKSAASVQLRDVGILRLRVCVCVTPKGRRWYAMIYIPERVFQISAPFHFLCVHDAGAGL